MDTEPDWSSGATEGYMSILIISAIFILGIITCFSLYYLSKASTLTSPKSSKNQCKPEEESMRRIGTSSKADLPEERAPSEPSRQDNGDREASDHRQSDKGL